MEQLSRKMKIGYGAGTITEAGFYEFSTAYMLLYLTSVAHLSPVAAGTIISITLLVEGFGGVVAGNISDQFYSRLGKRRPFILAAGIAACILFGLFFLDVSSLGTGKLIYYFVVSVVFWAAYSTFYINYIALGGELSDSYQERISIRAYCRFFSIMGSLLGTVIPLILVSFFESRGLNQRTSWLVFAIILATLAISGCLISWRTTRGMEHSYTDYDIKPKKTYLMDLLRDYWELIRLKCMSMLLLARVFIMLAFAFYTTTMIYYMKFKMGFDDSRASSIFIIGIVASIVYIPLISAISSKFGKHALFHMAFLLAGLCGIIITVMHIEGMAMVFVYICINNFAFSSFWQISNAMFYDIGEVDEFRYGKKRMGNITSLMSLIGTIGISIGLFITGFLLKVAGFVSEADVQSAGAVGMIEHIYILFPAIAFICAAVVFLLYPLSEKRFDVLKNAIELRNRNESIGSLDREVNKLYWHKVVRR